MLQDSKIPYTTRTFSTMTRQLKLAILLLLTVIMPSIRHSYVTAANSTETLRLLNDVIDPNDNRVRPIVNQSKPIDVYVTYNLVNLVEIDEVNQRISLSLWVNFSWWDELRTWNPDDYGGNDVIHPNPRDIWRPRTVLTNSAGERDVFKDIDSPLSIYSSGATRLYVGGIYYYICSLDLTYFPFDEQSCNADVMSTNLGPEINFIPSREILLGSYIANGEWELKSTQVLALQFPAGVNETLPFLVVRVTFRRLPTFYLVNVLIPTMCLSFLSVFGFVVPKDSGERASFSITVLLALAVYMGTVSGQLPANSDTFPLISVYIFSLMCLSMLSVLIIVWQLRMLGSLSTPDDTDTNGFDQRNENDSKNGDKEHRVQSENASKKLITNYNINKVHPISTDHRETQNDYSNEKMYGHLDSDSNGRMNNNKIDNFYNDEARVKNALDETRARNSYARRWKKVILKYDDAILLVAFTFIWALFTIIFVALITGQPS